MKPSRCPYCDDQRTELAHVGYGDCEGISENEDGSYWGEFEVDGWQCPRCERRFYTEAGQTESATS